MPRRGENIRKRKDGRWEGRYIKEYDCNGKAKYHSVYGKSYLEIKEKMRNITEETVRNDALKKERNFTFQDILYLWLKSNQINLKNQTYSKYVFLIENHIIPILGNVKIERIESELLNQFLYEQSLNGRLDKQGGLAASYLQTIHFIITSALDFSVKEGYRSSFIGKVSKPNMKKNLRILNVLTAEEQNLLENYLLQETDTYKLGILLSICMGLRIGEVCGLKWEDIDVRARTLHIQHTVERISNTLNANDGQKTILALCDTKTISSNRIIPIPSIIFSQLKKFQKSNGFVVPGKKYEYTDPRTLQNKFHKALISCGLKSTNFHALRHTFATRCIETGFDIKTLSEILGHSNVTITLNIYVHSSLEHKRKQIELLSSIRGQ